MKTAHTTPTLPRAMVVNASEAKRRRRLVVEDTATDASDAWIAALHGPPVIRDAALADLHELLLRGARFRLSRSSQALSHGPNSELDDLATAAAAANDALTTILAKLDSFDGASRFTTWASKFVLFEAGVKTRRRAWRAREVSVEIQAAPAVGHARPSTPTLEEDKTLRAVHDAVRISLTPYEREVYVALALNGVPIDVLAERSSTPRSALYQTLHDARQKFASCTCRSRCRR